MDEYIYPQQLFIEDFPGMITLTPIHTQIIWISDTIRIVKFGVRVDVRVSPTFEFKFATPLLIDPVSFKIESHVLDCNKYSLQMTANVLYKSDELIINQIGLRLLDRGVQIKTYTKE